MKHNRTNKNGYVLLSVLVVLGVAVLISAGMLQWASSSLSTRTVVESNTKNFMTLKSRLTR